ncbi:MAG TPA: prolyl oligopeptidase family serine peptidase [Terriglobales bacterium]|nr:prolyl oligopeptidase family serine peptidase [Terriglobales bacterium]
MRTRYQRWMHDWEYRLTTRDTNRVVRPLDWGLDCIHLWPCINGEANAAADVEQYLLELNRQIIADSDTFYAHRTPSDFRLEKLPPALFAKRSEDNWNVPAADFGSHLHSKDARLCLRFTSPVKTPHEANNIVTAQWFPANGRKAVIVMPQWNADGDSHNGLCRIFNFLGIAALRLSMPYHDVRMPAELQRADYACSSNIARTIDATRQAVLDARACIDWLELQGYTQIGIMGTSLGSCYAFITAAHEPRITACAYNHASTYFGDVVWTGQSTRHIRQGLEGVLDQDRLRALWAGISPMSYFDQYQRFEKKSLVVYATYDLTFLPEFSKQVVAEFQRRKLNFKVSILPCGHYTTGETPYKFLDAFYLSRFLSSAF